MSATNRLIVAILAITALAIAFWILLLGPKREEASQLGGEVETLQVALGEAESKATRAEAARRLFPDDYRQLVTLGQAVPASDETSSLLVELNRIANRSEVSFESLLLTGSGETAAPVATAPPPAPAPGGGGGSGTGSGAVPAAATVPPTEVAAATMPLGASVGPAGLAVMPYSLTFRGSFFEIADFIRGVDSLVEAGSGSEVAVDGRLVTLDGFALSADPEDGFPTLNASFAVTTYLTPPQQGVTAGASPAAPAPSTATPAGAESDQPEPAESVPAGTER